MTSASDTTNDNAKRAASIHREILQLSVLFLIAVVTFFLTRALAANNRDMSLRDAAEWFRRGQGAIAAGKLDEAIDAFRRAAVRNRTDKTYVLALARALALNHAGEAARAALLTLRDSAPEDADVNLELARLAAERQDVTEALRFYHNAFVCAVADRSGRRASPRTVRTDSIPPRPQSIRPRAPRAARVELRSARRAGCSSADWAAARSRR